MRAWAVVENGAPLKELELPTPEPKGTEVLIRRRLCDEPLREAVRVRRQRHLRFCRILRLRVEDQPRPLDRAHQADGGLHVKVHAVIADGALQRVFRSVLR